MFKEGVGSPDPVSGWFTEAFGKVHVPGKPSSEVRLYNECVEIEAREESFI